MEIRIESLLEGAKRAKGTVVIVDVFRAFTTAAVALARGADRIVMVAEIDEARRLRAGLAEVRGHLGEPGAAARVVEDLLRKL